MSVLSGNSNTNLSTILYGTNKTVQEVYLGNALVWSAQSTSFSFRPPTLYNLSNDGGSVDITFTPGISDYVAGTWPAWVSSVTPTVVSGVTTKITVTYGENASTSTRDGNLTFFAGGENRTVPMSQQAADVTVTSELNFVGVGGTQKIYITGSFSSWRINSAPLWVDYASSTGTTSPIDITADSNDTGSSRGGTISLTVDGHLYSVGIIQAAIEVHKFKINPTPSNATVLIDGQQRTNNEAYFAPTAVIPWEVSKTGYVTQSGRLTMGYTDYTMNVTLVAATYTLSVNPESLTFNYNDYSTSSKQTISITSNQSWTISVPSGFSMVESTSGSGNATRDIYPATYNSGSTNKTGTLRITGNDSQYVDVSLTQKALIMTLDPTELNVSASGGSYAVTVGDPNNYGWTISSNQSWCSVEPSSGTGNATVSVSIGQNSGSSNRGATITLSSNTHDIADITCAVSQSAAQAITFDPPSVSFDGAGSEEVIGINGTFYGWEVTSWPNWCTCEMTSGESNNPILIEAGANTGSTTRTGTLVVEVDGVAYQLALSQISASAVTYNFIVSASPSGCTVLINDSVRTNNTFACPAGTEVRWSVSKTGYVTQSGNYTMGAADHTETVTLAVNYTLSVSPNILSFAYDTYSTNKWDNIGETIKIDGNDSWSLTMPSWCRTYGDTTSGTAPQYIKVSPNSVNSGSSARTGTITITGTHGATATVSVTQNYDTTALQSITVKCGTGTGDTDEVGMNDSCSFYEVYAPSGTTATGVTWSIVSMTTPGSCTGQMIDYGGDSYYTVIIDGSASIGDKIKIRATSTVNPSIYGEKEVTVTYDAMDVEDLPESVEIDYSDFTYNAGSYVYMGSSYQMQATVNPLTASQDVTWSLKKTNGSTWTDTSKVSITPSGLLTISANSWTQVKVVATCVADDSITDSINMLLNHG